MALDLGIAAAAVRPTAAGGGLGLGQLGVGAGPRGSRGGGLYTRRPAALGGGLDGPCRAYPLGRPGRVPPDRPHFRPRPGLQYQAVPARPAMLSC
jgi:hypothetical protein